MSRIFAQLPENLINALATNAGIVLGDFNPDTPGEADAIRQNILFATTGGVNPTCVAELGDMGEDIDNCPKMSKEMAVINSWECKLAGTAVTLTKETAGRLFGASDTTTTSGAVHKITPRNMLALADFKPIWYVCPYGTDGFVAIKLVDALSIGGFSMQSTDKNKGQFAFEFQAFSSIETPDVVPFEFYMKEGSAPAVLVEPAI